MECIDILGVSKPVSRLILGTASPVFSGGSDNCALLDYALERGVNTIDTDCNYGLSERSIGTWLLGMYAKRSSYSQSAPTPTSWAARESPRPTSARTSPDPRPFLVRTTSTSTSSTMTTRRLM